MRPLHRGCQHRRDSWYLHPSEDEHRCLLQLLKPFADESLLNTAGLENLEIKLGFGSQKRVSDSGDRGRPSRTRREAAREALGQSTAPFLEALADPRWHMGLPALLVATAIVAFMVLWDSRPEVVPETNNRHRPQAVTLSMKWNHNVRLKMNWRSDRPMIPDDRLARLQEDLVAVGSAIRAARQNPEPEHAATPEATWQVKNSSTSTCWKSLVDNDVDASLIRGRLLVRLSSGRSSGQRRSSELIRTQGQRPHQRHPSSGLSKKPLHHWRKIISPNAQPTITLDRDRRAQLELQRATKHPKWSSSTKPDKSCAERVPGGATRRQITPKPRSSDGRIWPHFGCSLLVMAPLAGFPHASNSHAMPFVWPRSSAC